MAAEKVTMMVLKVDLHCSSCYSKIKKTLCEIPRGKSIKSIEIMEPNKPTKKTREAEKSADGPKAEPSPVVVVAAAKGPEQIPVGVPSVFPYDGYGNAGPYNSVPPPARPCYEGFYGNGHAYGRSYDRNYFSEKNSQGCSIM